MAIKKSKSKTPEDDVDTLRADVASFASSIGLSNSLPHTSTSGFDDSDFRKKGPLKPRNQAPHNPPPNQNPTNQQKNSRIENNKSKSDLRPKAKAAGLQPHLTNDTDSNNNLTNKSFDKFKNLPKLPLVKASALGIWYVDAAELEEKVIGREAKKKFEIKNLQEWKDLVEKKKELGERLLAQYVREYESSRGQSGDIKMLISTQRSGTAVDKVSAFSVMVGDNTVANIRSLDVLLGMVTSKIGKRYAFTAFDVLKELFVSSLLPDRKLKTLFQQPLNLLPETKDGYALLLFWYWEDCLKERYERFVSAIEEASRDVLSQLKDKALKTIYALLKSKPEQERRLLSALVNKLGDPGKKVASNTDFHLSKLLADHPSMKAVVIDEVDNFLFRPHLGLQAKFYAVNFLTQIRLSHKGDGPKVAKRLIDVYFALFKVLISDASGQHAKNKNIKEEYGKFSSSKNNRTNTSSETHVEMDSRLLTALLTGVNRAFPFVLNDESDEIIEAQTPILFQLVHSKSFNVGVQALMLLDKISSRNQIVSDRFYRALYSKLLLPAALNSSKEEMFIGLLLRAMKNDINLKRVAAFSKRLLQVALQQPPQYACGCLFLLSEVLKARPPLWNMVLQNELVDEDLEHFVDVPEDVEHEGSKKQNERVESPNAPRSAASDLDGDPLLCEDDSALSGSEENALEEANDLLLEGDQDSIEVSKRINDGNGLAYQPAKEKSISPGSYNPQHREPLYCNADRVSWWELTVLASHVHPSVATMAKTLLSGANIVYNGNPLNDLSLAAFLDKFMAKKPKQSTWHGASEIEPAKKLDMNNQLIGPEILLLAETDVPPEDIVFHKFYTNKMYSTNKLKKKKKVAEDEAAEELYAVDGKDDESDNEEIENMFDSSNTPLEADGDYDYDDLDNIANEDDDDLIGKVSDEEIDIPSHIAGGELEDADIDFEDDDGDEVGLGEADDGSDEEATFNQRKRKGKSRKNATSTSPFASLEDYEHLMNEGSAKTNGSNQKKSHKTKKKRVFKHSDWIGKPFGSKVFSSKGGFIFLLAPTPELWTLVLSHRTQILYIADISFVIMFLEIIPGCVVLESGTGSGSLTTSLARAVAPRGHVYTFDFHEQRASSAREDFEKTGLSSLITVGVRDIQGEGFPDKFTGEADSVFLDLPQPWLAIPSAGKMLKEDGVLCSFSPCIEQVQRSCETLKSCFTDIRTFEVLLRSYEVREENLESWQNCGGSSLRSRKKRQRSTEGSNGDEGSNAATVMARPSSEGRGHTGYLTFARLRCVA